MPDSNGGAFELQSLPMTNDNNERQELLSSTANNSSDTQPERAEITVPASTGEPHPQKEWAGVNGRSSTPKQSAVELDPQQNKRLDDSAALLAGQQRSASLGFGTPLPLGGTTPVKELTPRKRYYAIVIFTLTASLLYADQNLMAPLLTPIAAEFGFNDEEKDRYLGGYIAALFFAVGAPSAMLVGYLCDRMSRRNLLFIVVLLGEGPCLATYFVSHYWQLLMLRVMTGVSVGGTLPLVYSLVGDLFDVHKRATVAAGIQVATVGGLAAGQGISGFVGPATGWRWPFVIVAVPAILLAILMILTTAEPPRGAVESALQEQYQNVEGFAYEEKLNLRKVRIILSTPSNACVILQGLPGSLPWGVFLTFLNDFLAKEQRLSIAKATLVILWWGVGGFVGVVGGGLIGQMLYNRRPALMPLFVGACVSTSAFPIWFLVNADIADMSLFWPFAATFVGGMLASPPGPNARAVLLNVNEPESRGFALGLMTVLDDIGKGTGPFIVSELTAAFKRRVPAFNIAIGAWIPCGMIFACASLTLSRDESRMQERLKNKASQPGYLLSGAEEEGQHLDTSPRSHTYP